MTDALALVDAVARALRSRGERMTAPRRAVLLALAADPGRHLGAEEVAERVSQADTGVHRASVYRSLDALVGLGVVQHVHLGKGGTAYHLAGPEGQHLHAQCTTCGRLVDLPPGLLDGVCAHLRSAHGFRLDAGHVALAGTCARCTTSRG